MAQQQRMQVAVTETNLGAFLEASKVQLQGYAKRKYDQAAWLKTAMLCVLESKDLMACLATEAGKASLYHALRYAATTGLSLNPQEGKACLVPRAGKIAYWIMSRGWVELLTENPRVDRVQGFIVYRNDDFALEQTLDGDKYTHRPALDERGDIRGFVSAIRMHPAAPGQPAQTSVHYMTMAQMQKHRDTYETFKSADSAWAKSFEGRGIAACVKQHVRRLALGEAIVDAAVEADGAEELDTEAQGTSAADLERKVGEGSTSTQPADAKSTASVGSDGGLF